MLFLGKPIDKIDEADLLSLITDEVRESRTLDYKLDMPGNADPDKREFLYDISAMANSGGGLILYGVEEEKVNNQSTGKPIAIPGVSIAALDAELLRLDQITRSGIAPRIPNVRFHPIEIPSKSTHVIAGVVPHSLTTPHMVTFGGGQRFYGRNSTGKFPMDINEIREAVISSGDYFGRVEKWIAERRQVIEANQTFIQPRGFGRIIQHIVPVSSLSLGSVIPVELLGKSQYQLLPWNTGIPEHQYCLDGYITFHKPRPADGGVTDGYVQIFRKGMIEVVDTTTLEDSTVPTLALEQLMINRTAMYLNALKQLDIPTPIVIAFAFSGVLNKTLALPPRFTLSRPSRINYDDFALVPVVLNEWLEIDNIETVLRPVIDNFWNACGWEGSPFYDAVGKWDPK